MAPRGARGHGREAVRDVVRGESEAAVASRRRRPPRSNAGVGASAGLDPRLRYRLSARPRARVRGGSGGHGSDTRVGVFTGVVRVALRACGDGAVDTGRIRFVALGHNRLQGLVELGGRGREQRAARRGSGAGRNRSEPDRDGQAQHNGSSVKAVGGYGHERLLWPPSRTRERLRERNCAVHVTTRKRLYSRPTEKDSTISKNGARQCAGAKLVRLPSLRYPSLPLDAQLS